MEVFPGGDTDSRKGRFRSVLPRCQTAVVVKSACPEKVVLYFGSDGCLRSSAPVNSGGP
jgi:hypothetical protein